MDIKSCDLVTLKNRCHQRQPFVSHPASSDWATASRQRARRAGSIPARSGGQLGQPCAGCGCGFFEENYV